MKVFGIGWHKTATHSLQSALDMLGFEGTHFPYKAFGEVTAGHTEITDVESQKSLTDFPVPLIFKELDLLYPKSKYILTLRSPKEWLRSVRKHFDFMETPQEAFEGLTPHQYWEDLGRPISEMHTYAYGQSFFEQDVFLERYQDHNQEVLNYFRSRQDDLLVMDMSKGAGWKELCGFLGVKEPSKEYPFKNTANNRV